MRTEVNDSFGLLDTETLLSAIEDIQQAQVDGRTIWTAGNGGSAANASHFAEDLGLAGIRAICLSSDAPRLTALANDFGYSTIFEEQLALLAQPGDVLCLFSVSGRSENIVTAMRASQVLSLKTILFTGRMRLSDDISPGRWITFHGDNPGIVESGHLLLCHLICGALWRSRKKPQKNFSA